MARRGVWELQELLIKYSLDGGSSRGVREFVETGLVSFAKRNPQISIATRLRAGHPTVEGKYSTFRAIHLSTSACIRVCKEPNLCLQSPATSATCP